MATAEAFVPTRMIIKAGKKILGTIDLRKYGATNMLKLNKSEVSSSCGLSGRNFSTKRSSMQHGNKPGSQDLIEDQPKKRQKIMHKGVGKGGRHHYCPAYVKELCQMSSKSIVGSTHGYSSTITSDGSHMNRTNLPPHSLEASKKEIRLPASRTNKSVPSSNGRLASINTTNVCSDCQPKVPPSNATSARGLKTPAIDVQMPAKASLRTEMLLNRFASTISRAKQKLNEHDKKVVDHVKIQRKIENPKIRPSEVDEAMIRAAKPISQQKNKEDHAKIQQEKEKTPWRPCKIDRKTKSRAEVRAMEGSSHIRAAEIEQKRKIQNERKAARLALEKIQNTTGFTHNMDALLDFEMLFLARKLATSSYVR